MYKVCFVEDEIIFTEFMMEVLNWNELGCEVAGTAIDGIKAVELVEACDPDILFLDINIPILSGMEVCKTIRERGHRCEVVIVSSLQNFEIAQSAIKYDVSGYLLKPFDKRELCEVLEKCFQRVRQRRSAYFSACISNDVPLDGEFVVSILRKKASAQELYDIAVEIETEYLRRQGNCYFVVQEDQIIFAMNVRESEVELCPFFLDYADRDCVVGTGDVSSIKTSLAHAQLALENRALTQQNVICFCHLDEVCQGASFSQADLSRLIESLNRRDKAATAAIIVKIFGLEGNKSISLIYFKWVLYSITLTMLQYFGSVRSETVQLLDSHDEVISQLMDSSNVEDMVRVIQDYVYRIHSDCTAFAPVSRKSEIVDKINQYIASHFQEKHLTIEKMAAQLLFENSYLRRVYKIETGITILKALENYRINKAKELLQLRSLKHSEIAERVGFSDQYYFSKRFKQVTGYTPSEYENTKIEI